MNLPKWKLVFLISLLPILLSASENLLFKPSNTLDCPTTDLIINSSEVNDEVINAWLEENEMAFKTSINNLGGLWALNDVTISHNYAGTLPRPVCAADDGGLLVIFKATNSEQDVIRCGARLILLDNELVIPEDETVKIFGQSPNVAANISVWLLHYANDLRTTIANGPSKESRFDLIVTNDYSGIAPPCVCMGEAKDGLIINFTVEDKCGNLATHTKRVAVEDNAPPKMATLSRTEVERREQRTPEFIGSIAVVDNCTPKEQIEMAWSDDTSKISTDTILRKWIAADLCGNTDSIIQLINLVDRATFLDVPCSPTHTIIRCFGTDANNSAISAWSSANLAQLKLDCSYDSLRQVGFDYTGGADCGRRFDGVRIPYQIFDNLGNSTLKYAYAKVIDDVPPTLSGFPDGGTFVRDGSNPHIGIGVNLERSNFESRAIQFGLSTTLEAQCSFVQYRASSYTSGNPDRAYPTRRYQQYFFTYGDECGNSTTLTPTFYIQDDIPPEVPCTISDTTLICLGDSENEEIAKRWNEKNLALLNGCARDQYFAIKSITSDYNFIDLSGKCSEDKSLMVTYTISDEFDNKVIKTATFSIVNPYSPCSEIAIQTADIQLNVSNLIAPNSIVKVFDANYQIISTCTGDCPETVIIPNLTAGEIYHTDIQFYDENWQFICVDKRDIIIESGNEPCDTSICQGDVVLRTQAEVDAFCGCEVIEGDLIIGNPDRNSSQVTGINLIANLSKLKSVKGKLLINKTRLVTLLGLENLSFVGIDCIVEGNELLFSLSGLNSLKKISGNLGISRNMGIESLDGLNLLDSIGGVLALHSNPKLSNIEALENLSYFNPLSLASCPLTSISSLSNVKNDKIQSLNITNCDELTNLDGLEFIKSVEGNGLNSIVIGGNDKLENIGGLKNIKFVSDGMTISANMVLNNCCPIRHLIDQNLDNGMVEGSISLQGNLQYCNSAEAIIQNCQNPPSTCQDIQILTENNQITIQDLTTPNEIIKVFDKDFNILYECAGDCEETQIAGTFPAGDYTIDIQIYDENWQQICAEQRSITLSGVPVGDCASIEVTTNNRQITISGLISTNEKVAISALREYRSGNVSTTTFYQLKGDFTLSEIDGKLILDFADNYIAEDSMRGLYLYLTNDPNSVEEAFEIGPVKIFEGEHSYEIEGVALDEYGYLLYYCKPFQVKVGEGKINTERQIVFECTNDCGDAITTEALPMGMYQIDVRFFDQEGGELCDYQQNITLVSDLPCQEINITTSSNLSELVISTPSVPNAIIKIFDANWQILYECISTCENELVVPVENAGIYHTDIQFYDEHWVFTCEDKRDIEVIEVSEPCDTTICQGDVILRTQAEVDAFCGCEVIEGDFQLGVQFFNLQTSDIDNIDNLKTIKRVSGTFQILRTQLFNLEGLNFLESVNSLVIDENQQLESLDGLDNLHTVESSLNFKLNTKLINLNGLVALEHIGLTLILSGNEQLTSIEMLKNVKNTSLGRIFILDNDVLMNLEGLNNIKTVEKRLGLGILVVSQNDKLTNISALNQLLLVDSIFTISDNVNLKDCCPISHLLDENEMNGQIDGRIFLEGNDFACKSVQDINNTCNESLSICENVKITTTVTQLLISNLTAPIQIVKVFDNNYARVYECFAECAKTIDLPNLEAGRYHVNINFYDENWNPICERVETVEIGSSAQDRNAQLLATDFALFPNPAATEAHLDLSKLKGEQVDLVLFNQFGQKVQEQTNDRVGAQPIKIDLAKQLNGVYILQIIAKGKRPLAKKLIVNRLY